MKDFKFSNFKENISEPGVLTFWAYLEEIFYYINGDKIDINIEMKAFGIFDSVPVSILLVPPLKDKEKVFTFFKIEYIYKVTSSIGMFDTDTISMLGGDFYRYDVDEYLKLFPDEKIILETMPQFRKFLN